MNIRKLKEYKKMDRYTACAVAEGFYDGKVTKNLVMSAWQWLVDTGICWQLQGWYGRTASDLIEIGKIAKPLNEQKDYYGNKIHF